MKFFYLFAGTMLLASGQPIAAQKVNHGHLTIADPWARQTAPGQSTGGGYMIITNAGRQPDRLVAASSPAAAKVEIHTMSIVKGVMRMRPLPAGLRLPAAGRQELKPGGYHIMLIGLKRPLKLGTRIPVTLRFQRAGAVPVQLEVKPVTYGTGAGQ